MIKNHIGLSKEQLTFPLVCLCWALIFTVETFTSDKCCTDYNMKMRVLLCDTGMQQSCEFGLMILKFILI